jgi:NADPH:quinone reductase-like Zn-dependent oxidoreductase
MRVVEVRQYGGPEVLGEAERPDPAPAPGRVRVRIAAATVNPVDLWAREGLVKVMTPGLTPPFVLGWDLAGTVLEDAEGFRAGQRVVGLVPWFGVAKDGIGTHAEIVSAEPGWLAPLPAGVDLVEAATLGLNAPTAAQVLDLLGLHAGETLLVTGASGAVGGFAVQLAAAGGASVVAVASGPDDESYLAGIGAKHVLPRTAPDELAAAVRAVHGGGVDAVFDAALLGPPVLGAVRDGGMFVSASAPAAPAAERGIQVQAVGVRPNAPQLAALAADLGAGRLTTRVAETYGLDRAADAHRRAATRGLRGKVVLTTS